MLRTPPPLPEGLDAWVDGLHGYWKRFRARRPGLYRDARRCSELQAGFAGLDDKSLRDHLDTCAERFRRDPVAGGGFLLESLALVGEMARRTLQKSPYIVQYMGALALHRGWLAEMATGEGKTLTVSLAAILAGWSGRACHVVTANDYLAERDAAGNAPLYQACGVSVAAAPGEVPPEQRQTCYDADVVYVTAKTLLADFLRDRLMERAGQGAERRAFEGWLSNRSMPGVQSGRMLQRGLHTALVDEADSVLIDEAVTPLILSAPRETPGMKQAVLWASHLADQLQAGTDYRVDFRTRLLILHDSAHQRLALEAEALSPEWRTPARREELIRHALMVRHFILPGHQYLRVQDKVVLLDEFTGRMTPERTLTAGLHQAIEAREQVPLTDPNESLGQMSFQSFFRRFTRLAGTTGTAREAAAELWRIYQLVVVRIPTHKPRLTRQLPPRVYSGLAAKWDAVVEEILRAHDLGQPVLVGVRSVESSRHLARRLAERGAAAELLNAERHAEEARIIARAGEAGRITIATNMAGRGTDIVLDEPARRLGGLHVIIAECNESGRIDRQLAGRCGRQGDPGSVVMIVCQQDTLLVRFGSKWWPRLLTVWPRHLIPIDRLLLPRLVRTAQQMAENEAFARRKAVLQADHWLETALPFGESHG